LHSVSSKRALGIGMMLERNARDQTLPDVGEKMKMPAERVSKVLRFGYASKPGREWPYAAMFG
jgi:hypothetical protein